MEHPYLTLSYHEPDNSACDSVTRIIFRKLDIHTHTKIAM